jgi:hypothetical protein
MPKISNLPHGEEENKSEKKQISKVRMHFTLFMRWIGQCINEQVQLGQDKGESQKVSMTIGHSITMEERQEEVIARAKAIVEELESVKRKLTNDFEGAMQSFVSKCIDPMIVQIYSLIQGLERHNGKIEGFEDLLEKAIVNVELYDQFHDEKKLKKKIIQEAELLVKQSINKDIEILKNYKLQAIDTLHISSQEREMRLILVDRFLHPVMTELAGMLEQVPNTHDLHEFFSWKSRIDDRRSSLVELGLLTTDAALSQFCRQESLDPSKPEDRDEMQSN